MAAVQGRYMNHCFTNAEIHNHYGCRDLDSKLEIARNRIIICTVKDTHLGSHLKGVSGGEKPTV